MASQNFRLLWILTLAVFLGVYTTQSQVQPYASLLRFTADPGFPVRPNPEHYNHTNSLHAVLIWIRPAWDGTNPEAKTGT